MSALPPLYSLAPQFFCLAIHITFGHIAFRVRGLITSRPLHIASRPSNTHYTPRHWLWGIWALYTATMGLVVHFSYERVSIKRVLSLYVQSLISLTHRCAPLFITRALFFALTFWAKARLSPGVFITNKNVLDGRICKNVHIKEERRRNALFSDASSSTIYLT